MAYNGGMGHHCAMKPFRSLGLAILVVADVSAGFAQTNALPVRLDDETRQLLRKSTADHWFKKDAFFSTVVGGVLAAAGGLVAVTYAEWSRKRRKLKEDAEFRANVLRAIRCELIATREVYDQGIGAKLKEVPDGQLFPFRLGLTQDWFTIFNANAVHLGKIDADISRQIIGVYTQSKQLIEEFRINNEYLQIIAQANIQRQAHPTHLVAEATLEQIPKLALDQAGKIKAVDAKLKVDMQELIALLDRKEIK
jgi:hypothetical protein